MLYRPNTCIKAGRYAAIKRKQMDDDSSNEFKVYSLSGECIITLEDVKRIRERTTMFSRKTTYTVRTSTRQYKITVPSERVVVVQDEILLGV